MGLIPIEDSDFYSLCIHVEYLIFHKSIVVLSSLLVVVVVDCYTQPEEQNVVEQCWHLGTLPGHYWVQPLKGNLADCQLTSLSKQGTCLVVAAVAVAEAAGVAAVVADKNTTYNALQSNIY